jgi:thioesterase domain-containing protein
MLDSTPAIAGMGGEEEDDISLLLEIVTYVANLWNKPALKVSRPELEALAPGEQMDYVLDLLRGADFLPPGAGTTALRRAMAVYRANALAVRSYRPGSYPGGLTLFKASDPVPGVSASAAPPEDLGWKELTTGPVDVQVVPGHHLSLLAEPNVERLAQRLRQSLEEVTMEALRT